MEREALDAEATVTLGSAGEAGGVVHRTWSRSHDCVRGHAKGSHIGVEATTGVLVRQTGTLRSSRA